MPNSNKSNNILGFPWKDLSVMVLGILSLFNSAAQDGPGDPAREQRTRPNIVLIYADDLGYGDVSCYGATKIHTPNIDRVASQGILFTNAHASSATCTPSRYSLLTGEYAWRKKGTGIAPGNAALLIDTAKATLPSLLRRAGYVTGAVGKWHLGLGRQGIGPDWNGEIRPGPIEIGFDYAFIMPATTDRVPCVYVENHRVVNLDPNDPIRVSYKEPVGDWPTGKEHPELLRMKATHGHDQTIINGIGRIGYMTGGRSALWEDDDIANVLAEKAARFISENRSHSFFLYFATHDIHVPRVPGPSFKGKSGLGLRGDAILQLDWTVGRIMEVLDSLHLTESTILLVSSDNGPVLDDGYADEAVEKLNGHTPSGLLRGGKYSIFDAGTRIPLIARWPGKIKAGKVSGALISQVDLAASFARLAGQQRVNGECPDSYDLSDALLGRSGKGRSWLVEQAAGLSIIEGNWKYIEPNPGPAIEGNTHIELGNSSRPQLYNLKEDIGEQRNLSDQYPEITTRLGEALEMVKKGRVPVFRQSSIKGKLK